MASSSNKPTAVHFTLIFFVMLSLILAVMFYLTHKEYSETSRQLATSQTAENTATTALNSKLAQEEAAKKLLGYQFPEMGLGATGEANTVLGALQADMQAHGKDLLAPTTKDTLIAMRAALDSANQELATLKKNMQDGENRMLALRTEYGDGLTQVKNSQTQSEAQLQQTISDKDEIVRQKDDQTTQLRDDLRREQVEKETIRDDYAKYRKTNEDKLVLLERQIDFLNDRLVEVTKVSFERADGEVRHVDNTIGKVWINRGSLDNLRPQVTFSVYGKDHHGIGRGVEDIKGKIEVTQILGPHLSEARIIDEDLTRPVAEGDPIYSPLWTAGRKEYFAFVGVIDINGDGKGDWKQLEEIIHNAGADVELRVTDEGLREPADSKITENTKFLVVGGIEDQNDFIGQNAKIEAINRVQAEHTALREEARLHGITIVNLNDFLSYIGFKPQQRLYQPGQTTPFTLKAGARSAGVDEGYGDRTSSGQTSELFRRNRIRDQKSSTGQTSELFGPN